MQQIQVLYEDNHLLAINKRASELVQADKTGDSSLEDAAKAYIKEKYSKPGDVFLGVAHRIDRPVSGAVLFARTSKALERLNKLFKDRQLKKTYWAIVCNKPKEEMASLGHYIRRDTSKNKSYVYEKEVSDSKLAELSYKLIASSDRYFLLEVDLHTGRHHQIRAQLSHIGCPIKGDLKYGAPRSNPGGGISLHSRSMVLKHPVQNTPLEIIAPVPVADSLWHEMQKLACR
jgi:23S rRNA pseudouridine1911/1915/1917 synthase